MRFESEYEVRYSETDAMGIVYHANYGLTQEERVFYRLSAFLINSVRISDILLL